MTHREIAAHLADLRIDLSDEALVKHLVRVAWHILPSIDPINEPSKGDLFAAHSAMKDALKAVVPEHEGDSIAADAMRMILTSGGGSAA